jgi:hypothetical protein
MDEGYPGYDFGISGTQVIPRVPSTPIPYTPPDQGIRPIDPEAPIKAEQSGFSERYRAYDERLVAAMKNALTTIQEGMVLAKTLEDQNYFYGRLAGFKTKVDEFIIIRPYGAKRRKTKKKRSRRS